MRFRDCFRGLFGQDSRFCQGISEALRVSLYRRISARSGPLNLPGSAAAAVMATATVGGHDGEHNCLPRNRTLNGIVRTQTGIYGHEPGLRVDEHNERKKGTYPYIFLFFLYFLP